MFLLTLKDNKEDGAYAVQDDLGHKVLFLFQEEVITPDDIVIPPKNDNFQED